MTAGLIIPVISRWDFRDSEDTWSLWTAVNSFLVNPNRAEKLGQPGFLHMHRTSLLS